MKSNPDVLPRRLPVLKFSILLLLLLSVLFPIMFAIITQQFIPARFAVDVLITAIMNTLSVLLIYGFIYMVTKLFGKASNHWYRYAVEYPAVLVLGFWYLILFYRAMTGSQDYATYLLNSGWQFRLYIGINMIGLTFIYLFITLLNIYQLILEKTAQTQRLQKEYAQVRLQALKSQVNPHFLFNSLSVLSSLVHDNAELSEKFIIQLSKAYRYILDQKDSDAINIKEELDFLDAYFFLLQIRFNNKVVLQQQIEKGCSQIKIVPLALQLLVENAVKHNKMSSAQPLVIEVFCDDEHITVRNKILHRQQAEESTGLGLQNIRRRYGYITKNPVIIETTNEYFTVRLPVIH